MTARYLVACMLLIAALTLARGSAASASETAATSTDPCDTTFETSPSADPAVRGVRITRTSATPDATVLLRLDGATTSYAYTLPHVAIDTRVERGRGLPASFASVPIAVALPAGVEVVDGSVGLLDGGPSKAPACEPSLRIGDGRAANRSLSRASAISASAGAAVVPTVGPLAPVGCAVPFRHVSTDGRPFQPSYPDEARRLGQTGTVRVLVAIRDDGTPHDATIESSSGSHSLDLAGVEAALRTAYAPMIFRCVPVSSRYEFAANFTSRP